MADQEFCQSCEQNRNCRQLYQQLGHSKGPSVTVKVVTAFLLPLVVFIISLAVFKRLLVGLMASGWLEDVLSFLSSAMVTFGCVLTTWAVRKRHTKNGLSRNFAI
jgi:hypothetical protein